jgi:MYXO-CTERM domain-containing protein
MRLPFRCALVLGCFLAAAALPAQTARPLRVLFIGNSLTAGNDVPALVQAMAALQGVDVQYTAATPGGYAIEDHWRDGHHRLLESGGYHLVVLQQGPSTLPESQANLREWAINWANHARRFNTRTALYMIWPVRTQNNGFELVSQSYRNAALAANASLFPAGEAWQQAIRLNPGLALYQSDDLHATPAGSFLAAMVIARGLVSLDPIRVPSSVRGVTVSPQMLASFRGVVESLPPSTVSAEAVSSVPPVPDPTPSPAVAPSNPASPAPSTPAASTAASGGGGAPSGWFLLALVLAGLARWQRPAGAR